MSTGKSHTALGLLALLALCGAVLSNKPMPHTQLAKKARYDFNHLNSWGYKKECASYSFINIAANATQACAQPFKLRLAAKFGAKVAESQAVSFAGNFGSLRVPECAGGKLERLAASSMEFRAHSGHKLNGTVFDAELIMYFKRKGCKAATHAVSVFLNAVASDRDARDVFRATFASARVSSAPIIYQSARRVRSVVLPARLRRFFAAGRKFYRYQGSLPTPPLTQNVSWFVFEKAISVSRDDIEFLNSKYSSNKFASGNNVAPVQPLNKREVVYTKIAGKPHFKKHAKRVAKKHSNKSIKRVVKSHKKLSDGRLFGLKTRKTIVKVGATAVLRRHK